MNILDLMKTDTMTPILMTKANKKTIDTCNEEHLAFKQSATYQDMKQVDDTISRETFLCEQAQDTDCQSDPSFVLKAGSNITGDTE